MSGMTSVGLQALTASRQALDVIGQNIANVNTPGYSRQSVNLAARPAPEQGVKVVSVERIVDNFATQQLWRDNTAYQSADTQLTFLSRLDDLIAGEFTNLSAAMDNYFAALQTVADDPSSIPNRQLFLAEADALARRFNELDSQFRGQNDEINSRTTTEVTRLNAIIQQVADINTKVGVATARGEPANELRDQRDELVKELSGILSLRTQENAQGQLDIFIGNGQPLVIGTTANTLKIGPGDPDPDKLKLSMTVGNREVIVGDSITGGTLGGMLAYRQNHLDPARQELGRLAMVFAETMNSQHRKGIDLDGALGGDLFTDLGNSGEIRASSQNQVKLLGSSQVVLTDYTRLKATTYTLTFTAGDDFRLVRESDGAVFTKSDFTAASPFEDGDMTYAADFVNGQLDLNIDGLTFSFRAADGFAIKDSYLIKPFDLAAAQIGLEVTSPRDLALASPLRAEVAADNRGSLVVDATEVTDTDALLNPVDSRQLNPPVDIVFDNAGNYRVYDVSDAANPLLIDSGAYTPGMTLALQDTLTDPANPRDLGYSLTLRGQPEPGDRLSIRFNTDGASDNRNAQALSLLQQQTVTESGSYQETYGALLTEIGASANVAKINQQASETVLKSSQDRRDAVSGVNLDEEAANLIRYQQQYQAASQLIATTRNLFETLLSVTGG